MQQRELLVQTGHELLQNHLVARTWGNISCRTDASHFLITPSGLDYLKTTPEDIVLYNMEENTWIGNRKPSSEKGVHASAYDIFPEVTFVIHTHQTYATALGLVGWDSMDITPDEEQILGGIARAAYGLPGQKSLKNNVKSAMQTGAHVILMQKHGVVVCATSKDEAMRRINLLEDICRRNCKTTLNSDCLSSNTSFHIPDKVSAAYPNIRLVSTPSVIAYSSLKRALKAQLDDMAQMIGFSIKPISLETDSILKSLKKSNVVFLPDKGALVNGIDSDDSDALELLTDKACICALHCLGSDVSVKLPLGDKLIMNLVYKLKYSKQKEKSV